MIKILIGEITVATFTNKIYGNIKIHDPIYLYYGKDTVGIIEVYNNKFFISQARENNYYIITKLENDRKTNFKVKISKNKLNTWKYWHDKNPGLNIKIAIKFVNYFSNNQ